MKAELLTGEIVTLEKGCNCITHNEPHWVHMDTAWRESNRKMLDPTGKDAMQQYFGAMGIAVEDLARLDQKLRMMKSLGINRLIPEASDELTDIQRQKMLNHFEDLRPPEPKQTPAEYLDTKTQVRIEAKERL
jgi:hypothetical protein